MPSCLQFQPMPAGHRSNDRVAGIDLVSASVAAAGWLGLIEYIVGLSALEAAGWPWRNARLFDAVRCRHRRSPEPEPITCSVFCDLVPMLPSSTRFTPLLPTDEPALFSFFCFADVLPRHFLFVIQPPLSSSFQRSTFQSTATSASQPAPDRRPPPKRRPFEGPADASRTSPIPPARHVGPVREGAHLRIHRLSEGPFRETDSIAGQRP